LENSYIIDVRYYVIIPSISESHIAIHSVRESVLACKRRKVKRRVHNPVNKVNQLVTKRTSRAKQLVRNNDNNKTENVYHHINRTIAVHMK
jgi:hypothetical protein